MNKQHFSLFHLPLTLIAILLAYLFLLIFGVANFILNNFVIIAIDTGVADVLYKIRDPITVNIFMWISLAEEWQIMAFILLSLAVLFIFLKKNQYILPLYISTIGSIAFSEFGKIMVRRIRPQGFIPVYIEDSFSFPSSHAAIAVAVFGFLAYIVTKNIKNKKLKSLIVTLAAIIILAIGLSRLYLGVHYFSDVLGGYIIGSIWLMLAISILEYKQVDRPFTSKDRSSAKKIKVAIIIFIIANIIYLLSIGPRIMPQII